MSKIFILSFSLMFLYSSKILQATEVSLGYLPKESEFLTQKSLPQVAPSNIVPCEKVDIKKEEQPKLKEGRRTTDQEALEAASRRADKKLGITKKNVRRNFREK